jgi:hypothetical protein
MCTITASTLNCKRIFGDGYPGKVGNISGVHHIRLGMIVILVDRWHLTQSKSNRARQEKWVGTWLIENFSRKGMTAIHEP